MWDLIVLVFDRYLFLTISFICFLSFVCVHYKIKENR